MNTKSDAGYAPDSFNGGGSYDLAVIGAGSAGFSAAITAADQGAQVALIGHGTIGGTCVNVGCVPSKTLIRAAETVHQAHAAARFDGVAAQAHISDWQALIAQKDELVAGMRQSKYIDLLPSYNSITYIEGRAWLAPGGVDVDGDLVAADKIIITTGSSPAVPELSGIEDIPYLTSTSALELETLPGTLLVIGGGYIGCELAQIFARAGVQVTIACRTRLLPEAEPEVSAALTKYFAAEGIVTHDGLSYDRIEQNGAGTTLRFRKQARQHNLTADKVLVATGRKPNTTGLGLEKAGIELNGHGGINVDNRMRTSHDGIYAAGDVTGRDQFVYMAAHGAKIAAFNALNGNSRSYDDSAIPAVVFTDPQVASVGLTETAAREQGFDVETSVLDLEHLPRAQAARDTRGLIKLVARAGTGKLVGAHILAPEGADSIQTAVLAIRHGMTVDELGDTIFPYLTTVEGLKLAAQTFHKDVAKLSCCAG